MAEHPATIGITVNQQHHVLELDPNQRLLDVLRDELGLTGTKEGCGRGECGACTVLLNGRPVNACMVPAFQADGADVITVEGMGTPEQPNPVQAALVAEGAVQCGFCTPGMVVAMTGHISRNPACSRRSLREALSGNICRCTGYGKILDAGEKVAAGLPPEPPPPDKVGVSAPKVDALEKATGLCRYTADLPLPEGCLHGVTVRAEKVHARLLSLETDEALAVPGVVAVLTWRDVPGELHYGNAVHDQPVLVKDHVRFWGEALALVLAESLSAAREAAALVKPVLQELPPVTSPEQALQEDSPHLHEGGNLLLHQKLRKGDVAAAMTSAHLVLERSYRTNSVEHMCLEPEAALAMPDGDGGVVVKAPSQNVFFDRAHICRTLGLHRKRVRVIQQPTGAAFGSREDIYAQIHAALGALHTGRPTRIVWTREETQLATTKRHPTQMHYKAALSQEGRLLALQVSVLADTGAYASWAPNIARKMLVHAAGPYEIPNISIDIRMAYTNNGISGAFRGFGAPQVAFAHESFMDEIARELGMDPLALRRENHLAVGKITATGQEITGSCGLPECMDAAQAAAKRRFEAHEPPPPHVARGMGVSTIFYGIGYGNAIPDIGSASVELLPGGTFRVRCGAIDYGQGALTVFTQIACQVLGVSRAVVDVWTGDTAETPDSGSTVASRQTYVSGEAVRQAARRLSGALLDLAAEKWATPRGQLALTDQGVMSAGGKVLGTLRQLHSACLEAGVRTRRQARFRASTTRLDLETGQGNAYWPYAFAVQIALVDVDCRTGQVRVVDIVAAHDVGKAINPSLVEGQITGGIAQGLGFALLEEHRFDRGVPLTTNLHTYRVPGTCDIPEILPILVEDPEPTGPFGAKGVGEPVLVAIAPAVANAVADATGIRVRSLPIRPELLREALPAATGGSRNAGGN